MAATPQEKVTVPVSREILAEVDDVVHLARARGLAADGSLDVELLQDKSRYRGSGL